MAFTVSGTELPSTATAATAAATTSFYDAAAATALAPAKLATTANERLPPTLAGPAPTSLGPNGPGSSYGFLHASGQSVSSVASSLLLPTLGCTTSTATAVAATTTFSTTAATATTDGQQQFALCCL